MFARRVENLVVDCRRETENEEFTDTTGIQDEEFIRYMNDAQEDLQSAIARQHQRVFVKHRQYDSRAQVDTYDLPEDIYLDNRITNVWYTETGNSSDYRRLMSGQLVERVFDKSQNPALYIRSMNQLILTPIPGSSTKNAILIAYVRRLPRLDVRRATVQSVTVDGDQITELIFDANVSFDRDALLEEGYISIVNRDGAPTMQQIPILDIDANTGLATVAPDFRFRNEPMILNQTTLEKAETIAVGDFAVRGRFGANVTELPTVCERYLLAYMNWKILKRDSNQDSVEQTAELQSMRQEIVDIFAEVDDDTKNIAIQNTQFLDDDDLFIFY